MKSLTLGEISDDVGGIIRTGPFGSQLHESDYESEGVPVIMPKDIGGGRVSVDSIARVSEMTANRLAQHRVHAGDIIYGRRGDIGRRALVTARESGWLCGTGCLRISLGDSVVDPGFLYYYLAQPAVISQIANQAIGATLPNLNTSILRRVRVVFPALATQRKIAAVLSTYDDLIGNNSRRIAILEETARLLYREWFVDFRFPGHESVRMVDSPLGPIPEGWPVKSAADAMLIGPSTATSEAEEKPFVPMGSLSSDSMLIDSIEWRSGNSGSKFRNGDTLFARITPCLENGKTAYVQFLPTADAVAIGSTEFIVLRSKTLAPEIVYLMSRLSEFRDNAIKSMSGASGRQRVRNECFSQFFFPHPPPDVICEFTALVLPFFRLIQVLANQRDVLRQTRDFLLPKLISGELKVEDLDIDVREEAA